MAILVTGGAGYIGSHACLELLRAGFEVVAVDNLCNSHEESLRRVRELAGKDLTFHRADLRDAPAVERIFAPGGIEAVLHFAGLKAVGESVEKPLLYWDNNIGGTVKGRRCERSVLARPLTSCVDYAPQPTHLVRILFDGALNRSHNIRTWRVE